MSRDDMARNDMMDAKLLASVSYSYHIMHSNGSEGIFLFLSLLGTAVTSATLLSCKYRASQSRNFPCVK